MRRATLLPPAGAAANNRFAFDLYARLRSGRTGENLCFSPFSISAALAMVHAGARGQTAEEIASVIRAYVAGEIGPPRYSDEFSNRESRPPEFFQVANALWAHEDYPIRGEYDYLLGRKFDAEIRSVDFVNEREPTRRVINDWISRKTNGRIPMLLDRPLSPLTRLILTNAVYFRSAWATPFDRGRTKREPFFVSPGDATDVWMMHDRLFTLYVEDDGYRAAAIEYEDGPWMWVIVPDENRSLADVEATLTADKLDDAWSQARPRDVFLSLPRFHVRARTDLREALADLGMPTAFTTRADFSGMHEPHPEPLVLGGVVHEAFTDVNEERTEAGAATATEFLGGCARDPEPPVEVRCDRPFIFIIRDASPGSILFMGRLVNPAGE